MTISKKDADKMITLAREGKQIARIKTEDFPDVDYWDIYRIVYFSGARSTLGAKKIITSRLNKLQDSKGEDRKKLISEIQDMVWYLYDNIKKNQTTFDKIRRALSE